MANERPTDLVMGTCLTASAGRHGLNGLGEFTRIYPDIDEGNRQNFPVLTKDFNGFSFWSDDQSRVCIEKLQLKKPSGLFFSTVHF